MQITSGGIIPAQFDAFAREFIAVAAAQKFPAADGAMSDYLSAEWEEAVARLINLEKEILAQTPKGQSQK